MTDYLKNLLASEAFWTLLSTAVVGYITNTVVSRGLVAKLPPTSPIRRAIRLLHGFLDRVDPKVLALAFAIPILSGCVGTLEESRGQLRLGAAAAATAPRASSLDARCQTLSDREYWFGGVAQGGAVLTGASGISTLPLEDRWETAAAAATLGVATVTAAAVYLERQANASYVTEGCGR